MPTAPATTEQARLLREVRKCRRSPAYFLDTYCRILSEVEKQWVPFHLWPAQAESLQVIAAERLLAILKARQLGFSWLVLGFALWLVLFHPITTVLLFSRRDDEAVELLRRLRGMFERLPPWLQTCTVKPDSDHEWTLASGSNVKAFPTTGGRSYTASLVVVDEADFVPDLPCLLDAVKPTVDAGGRLLLVSTPDKASPESAFKGIYRSARTGMGGFAYLFQPWQSRPDRTPAWYEAQRAYFWARDGSLDMLQQEYPATDVEALAPKSLDKRIAPAWLQQCYRPQEPLTDEQMQTAWNRGRTGLSAPPAIPGLAVYAAPVPDRVYVLGADPAEGNPTSDDSALTVLDRETGEEVAALAGKFQPAVLAAHADAVGYWYNRAACMVERNNHGHAVLLWFGEHGRLRLLLGHDGKPGWLSSPLGKTKLYDAAADAFRNGETILHTFAAYMQLSSIDGSTLRAPEGQFDDLADAYALALAGRPQTGPFIVGLPPPAERGLAERTPPGLFHAGEASETVRW